jgi:hypothetical protein
MKETHLVTFEQVNFEIDAQDVLKMVYEAAKITESDVYSHLVYVVIPGGGDWSNRRLKLDEEFKVYVKLTIKKERGKYRA